MDTCNISLGFPSKSKITIDRRYVRLYDNRLRELHFGEDEGRHFDSLNEAEKEK